MITDMPDVPPLRLLMRGQNAPLQAQLMYTLIHSLPNDVARHPGSEVFRLAIREQLKAWQIPLDPTRKDIAAGIAFLAKRNLLPQWVAANQYLGER